MAWTLPFQVGPAVLFDAANLFQVFGGEAHLTRHGTQLARQQPQLRLLDGNLVRGPLPVIGYRGQGGALGLFRPLGGLDPPGGCRLVRHLGGPGRFFQAPHRAARLFGCLAQAHQFTLAHAVGGFHRRDLDAPGLRIPSPVVDHQDRIGRLAAGPTPGALQSVDGGQLGARGLDASQGAQAAFVRNGPLGQLAHRLCDLVLGDPGWHGGRCVAVAQLIVPATHLNELAVEAFALLVRVQRRSGCACRGRRTAGRS
ncbi:MAG: hypothetical protein IPL15_22505 [Comamonadaceae bacterium]|uniref:hypothetical protein n=1 Tax=Candidatus Skiveiella danica TaxID=3386177 RepID=UPI00390B8297|nr:hypothetical protein [Comamonadaceae bacterium]